MKSIDKRMYNSPEIVCVTLDNQISLSLESAPPEGPNESFNLKQENPFKEEVGLV